MRLHLRDGFDDGREAHLALARAAAIGIVHLHVGDMARRHPAGHQHFDGFGFHLAGRAAVDHGLEAGESMASTMRTASATVLMRSVSRVDSGSMQ